VLKYGLLTASGREGGRAGVKVEPDCAVVVRKKVHSTLRMGKYIFKDAKY